MKVYKEQCDQCLLSKNRIVSSERAKDIIKECVNENTYFICHKSSIDGGKIGCKGFFDKFGDKTKLISLAKWLGIVKFVEQE
jgi:hypothetical protein